MSSSSSSSSSSSFSKEFPHLHIPLDDIKTATKNFSDENFIGKAGFGKAYRGQLKQFPSGEMVDVVVRRLDTKNDRLGMKQFLVEASVLSTLKHENLATLIGLCDEQGEKIIINKCETGGSLDKQLKNSALTWTQRLKICVGVARALSYIHYDEGRDFSVLHRNIKSSKILLDDNWNPKLSGFELSKKHTVARRKRLVIDDICGTKGYIDPRYIKTGGVSHKSDVYSLGVVLFEVLCGRIAYTPHSSSDHSRKQSEISNSSSTEQQHSVMNPVGTGNFVLQQDLLAQLAINHCDHGTLDDIIYPGIRKQMGSESLAVFSRTAYLCLKEKPSDRPGIDEIVKNLEKALDLQNKQENPLISKEKSGVAAEVKATSSNRWKGENMDHLRIRYEDIKSATSDFSEGFVGSGGYGKVYKAQLHHFDRKNSKAKQGKNLSDLPKVSNTVAIKKIFDRDDTQAGEGFSTEIKTLTSCMHPNVVSLVGFCDEDSHMILVYEFITKGSLDDYLRRINLRWIQRLEMCLQIAQGLKYLHTEKGIIHRDIKSANILLDDNLVPKIADFGLAKDGPKPQQSSSIETVVAGTRVYLDPDYEKTNKLKKASDIYSFGVVMFEMLTGKLAYTTVYKDRLSYFVQKLFGEGKLKDELDAKLKEEVDENNFTLAKGPNPDSLKTFLLLISRCLEETQTKRPTIEDVIKELKNALDFQENHNDNLKISLEDIKSAVYNFNNDNYVAEGGFGSVYKGEVTRNDGRHTIVAKRWHNFTEQGDNEFFSELEILLDYKHKNVIGLVGYCNEENEKIIVYEYVPRGTLRMQLKDTNLTWMNRLKISIDIASGIDFLHAGGVTNEVVMHRDIKSSHILLDDDWQAKITGFGLSCTSYIYDFVIDDNASGTHGYIDPVYHELKTFTRESDIYSLGVVLFEILSGRSTNIEGKELLGTLAQKKFKKEEIDDLVFDGIKDQIVPKALTTFQSIALRCLHDKREERPTIGEVLQQLKEALEFQEDYQKWQHKLPKDYEEILRIAHTPELYSTKKYKELYDIFCKGILLQEGDVFFALGDNGERIAMISATASFYINGSQYKFVPGSSRFPLVANMFDVLNLKIKVETRCQLLAQKVIYGVYLVFKFCDSREISSKPLYVNLKYQSSSKTSHAYFATKRDDEWMMIELWRFLNDEQVIDINFLLQSFSPLYYGDSSIDVEGIEFRPIHDVNEVQQVSKSESIIMVELQELSSNNEQTSKRSDAGDKLFLLNGVKRKIDVVDSAKMPLNDLSSKSRFLEGIELPPQQVFHINGTINNFMLLRDTDYVCYLVFKLLTEDDELHCPVKVQNLLNRKKEAEILYFKSPSSWNGQCYNQSPQLREDGWLEVKVWKISFNRDLKNDQLHVSLRFISYEGIMPGLIVYGLEFRSI